MTIIYGRLCLRVKMLLLMSTSLLSFNQATNFGQMKRDLIGCDTFCIITTVKHAIRLVNTRAGSGNPARKISIVCMYARMCSLYYHKRTAASDVQLCIIL